MDVYGEQSWWNFSCDLYLLFDGRPKRHWSDLQMSLWMEILSREKLHLLIYFVLFLRTLWMCYQTIKGILGSCESLFAIQYAFQFLNKIQKLISMLFNFWKNIQKLRFWYFFLGWFLLLWDRPQSFESRCGWLWVVRGFSNYGNFYSKKDFCSICR